VNCRICGNAEANLTHRFKEMMFGLRDEFDYIECSACGCLHIRDIPDDMSAYYPKSYYAYEASPPDVFRGRLKNFLLSHRNRYALAGGGLLGRASYKKFPNETMRLIGLTGVRSDWKILDVGCGAGMILYSLRISGYRNSLGIDPFLKETIRYSNGLEIRKTTLGELEGPWDVIMFHHSFEHVPDPVQQLKLVSRLLSARGVCLIRIPTVSSFAWRQYGANWVQIDAPRHFFLHSTRSLEIASDKAGLHINGIVYDSDEFQFWGSEQIEKGIPLEDPRSFHRNKVNSIFLPSQIREFKLKAQYLNDRNEGDQAAYYLRRSIS
jgi:SAM-dependent methyltransferase